jgi:hypothetical protein
MSDYVIKNLGAIRAALDDHNAGVCPRPATAILLNPADHERLGINKLWGLPVSACEKQRLHFVRIQCDGSAWGVEDELERYVRTPEKPEPVPVAPNEYPLAA